jgi:hypothetical protein
MDHSSSPETPVLQVNADSLPVPGSNALTSVQHDWIAERHIRHSVRSTQSPIGADMGGAFTPL